MLEFYRKGSKMGSVDFFRHLSRRPIFTTPFQHCVRLIRQLLGDIRFYNYHDNCDIHRTVLCQKEGEEQKWQRRR